MGGPSGLARSSRSSRDKRADTPAALRGGLSVPKAHAMQRPTCCGVITLAMPWQQARALGANRESAGLFLCSGHGLCCDPHAAVVVWSAPQQQARAWKVVREPVLCPFLCLGTGYAAPDMLRCVTRTCTPWQRARVLVAMARVSLCPAPGMPPAYMPPAVIPAMAARTLW